MGKIRVNKYSLVIKGQSTEECEQLHQVATKNFRYTSHWQLEKIVEDRKYHYVFIYKA